MSERLLGIKEVTAKVGFSHNWVYQQIKAGLFPAQIHFGPQTVRWLESEIDAWIIEQRDASRRK